METLKTETVRIFGVSRQDDTDFDDHVRAAVFGALVERAAPGVKHYRSDFFWDTVWLRQYLKADEVFLYSWDEAGTNIGTDPDVVLRRENCLSLKLHRDRSWWLLDITPLPKED